MRSPAGKVLIIAATRLTDARFQRSAFLSSSLRRMAFDPRIESAIAYRNREGIPRVFNRHIIDKNRDKLLLFTHVDVRIDDYWLSRRLDEALSVFDVVGVAGNRRRIPHQSSWAFAREGEWDARTRLTGAVCHPDGSGETVSFYGAPAQQCKLLDGLLLAVRASALLEHGLRFDEQFAFHFYDLDFCRAAESCGLTLGTWPIAVTHGSGGIFGSPAWKKALTSYRRKWRS
jgi:GT2 family glycosyltransferase